jgi:hypothetical protein
VIFLNHLFASYANEPAFVFKNRVKGLLLKMSIENATSSKPTRVIVCLHEQWKPCHATSSDEDRIVSNWCRTTSRDRVFIVRVNAP